MRYKDKIGFPLIEISPAWSVKKGGSTVPAAGPPFFTSYELLPRVQVENGFCMVGRSPARNTETLRFFAWSSRCATWRFWHQRTNESEKQPIGYHFPDVRICA